MSLQQTGCQVSTFTLLFNYYIDSVFKSKNLEWFDIKKSIQIEIYADEQENETNRVIFNPLKPPNTTYFSFKDHLA
jgi:hypothetical protein